MTITLDTGIAGTKLPQLREAAPLSYHAAMFALEISDTGQLRNSLIAAGTLLQEWLAGDEGPSVSSVAAGISPGDEAAATTARNILKALVDLAHMKTMCAHDVNTVVTRELLPLLRTIVDLVDLGALKVPESLQAEPEGDERMMHKLAQLRSSCDTVALQAKALLDDQVPQLLKIAATGLQLGSPPLDGELSLPPPSQSL